MARFDTYSSLICALRSWPVAYALAACCLAPIPVVAQAVAGTVVASDPDRPVAGARVVLIDPALAALDSTTTDGAGRFRLDAPRAGDFVLLVRLEGYLSVSTSVEVRGSETATRRIEMPLVSVPAALVMREAITREAAFQLPLDELCQEPLRPWEAGMLVGVTRLRRTMEPVPGALVTLEPLPPATFAVRTRVSTESGTFWFCNVPAGTVRLVVRARGLAADTTRATIHAGTISWYDGLLNRGRGRQPDEDDRGV
jgi:hypothetical protein